MPITYTTPSGVQLKIPGAYAEANVANTPAGSGTDGIVILLGEAETGPAAVEEADITLNSYGPDQKSDVIAKYKSGPIVDAFLGLVNASNDNQIQNKFKACVIAKSNTGMKATGSLGKVGGGTYGTVEALQAGRAGNLITYTVTNPKTEVAPSTGAFTMTSPQASMTAVACVNGGAKETTSTIAAHSAPSAVVSALGALSGLTVTGGAALGLLVGTVDIAIANVGGNMATFTSTADMTIVPAGSSLIVGGDANASNQGSYVVVGSSARVVRALKLTNLNAGTLVAPVTDSITGAGAADVEAYSQVTVSVTTGPSLTGLGKSLELAEGTGTFSKIVWKYNPITQSAYIYPAVSTVGAPVVLTSSQETEVEYVAARQSDGISDDFVVGGDVVFGIGYQGTSATADISNGVLTMTVSGGLSASLSPIVVQLSDFATLGDLAQYINSLGGFTAGPTFATFSGLASTRLDAVSFGILSVNGGMTGRLKADGAEFADTLAGASVATVVPFAGATTLVGLPNVSSLAFLTGGAKGGTANADIQAALDVAQGAIGQLVLPTFSQDAVKDIAAGLTDASSTYDILSIHQMCRAHALQMSTLKQRKRRICMLSVKDVIQNCKNAAASVGSERCFMVFQDCKTTNVASNIVQFQPWMLAVKAAGMQAGGVYQDITHKYIQVSGVSAVGYRQNIVSDVEGVQDAGLNPVTFDGKGYKWVNDQMTYTRDGNFVYNSLQAMYCLDQICSSLENDMENAFVGQSLANVTAADGLSVLGVLMSALRDRKLIAGDDEAPAGYKDAVVQIVGGRTMIVAATVKEATSLKFVSIQLAITPITQTATA